MRCIFYKIQCLCFFILLSTVAIGQTYHPVLNTDRVWQIHQKHFDGTTIFESYPEYTLGDTISVNNHIYYHFDFASENKVVREDTTLKQLYIYDISTEEEYVSFDFSLSIGDTLPSNFAVLIYSDELYKDSLATITNIDTVFMVDGSPRKRFHITLSSSGVFDGMYMIEGLGGPLGFIAPNPLEFETTYILKAVKENEDVIYGAWYYISVQEQSENQIEIYPNPVVDVLAIKFEPLKTVYVYNIFGEQVYESSESVTEQTIDFTSFKSGIYVIKGQNKFDETLFVKKIVKQ